MSRRKQLIRQKNLVRRKRCKPKPKNALKTINLLLRLMRPAMELDYLVKIKSRKQRKGSEPLRSEMKKRS